MLETENYLEHISDHKILDVIRDLVTSKTDICIWQKNLKQFRVSLDGEVSDFSIEKKSLKIKVDKPTMIKALTKGEELYAHTSDHTVVFKVTKFINKGDSIVIPIPKRVTQVNMRSSKRIVLNPSENNPVDHYKEKGLFGSEKYREYTLQCIDISQTGIALELRDRHLTRYRVGDVIDIFNICGVHLKDLGALIVYVKETSNEERYKRYKAGLKFSRVLTPKEFTEVITNIKVKSSTNRKAV